MKLKISLMILGGCIMFHAYGIAGQQPISAYSQDYLFKKVIMPTFKSYPEIAWFADDNVAATNEGTINSSFQSWTALLVTERLLENKNKKYIELERMLHSLVCLYLLKEGSESAYLYWKQGQKTSPLTKESFDKLHKLTHEYTNTDDAYKAIEASLVYSDLGKTPEAKKHASEQRIIKSDHDDFMEAIYSAPAEIRAKVIPSFEYLSKGVQQHILDLHLAVPLHWGHALHLEGGKTMFSRLVTGNAFPSAHHVKQAFIIQVCDVAASQAHVNPQGSVAFNELTWLGYKTVLEVVESLLEHRNTEQALLELTNKRAEQLKISTIESPEKSLILARAGSFLRLYTPIEGVLLQKAASAVWKPEDWKIIQEVFGLDSGINHWTRNPTYLTTVMLNLFNTPSQTVEQKYQKALAGMLVLAKIATAYQNRGHHRSEEPLCFNNLAAQAREHPEYFTKEFEISQINWSDPRNIVIAPCIPQINLETQSIWNRKKILSYTGKAIFVASTLLIFYRIFSKKNDDNVAILGLKLDTPNTPKIER